jgi:hypothetical protein
MGMPIKINHTTKQAKSPCQRVGAQNGGRYAWKTLCEAKAKLHLSSFHQAEEKL